MSAREKEIIQSITKAVATLPEEKREFILGYAEGVLAMAEQRRQLQPSAWPCPVGRRGGDFLEVIIRGEAKEIAALVLAVQERQFQELQIKVDGKAISKVVPGAIRDMPEDKQ